MLRGFGLIFLHISNILQVFDFAHIKSLQVALHRLLKHQEQLKMNIKTVAVCAEWIPVLLVVELILFLFSLSGRHMRRPRACGALWILQKHLCLMQILVQIDTFASKQCSSHWERKHISYSSSLSWIDCYPFNGIVHIYQCMSYPMRCMWDRFIDVVSSKLLGLGYLFIAQASGLEGANLIDSERQVSMLEVQGPLTVSTIMVSELISG